MDQEQNLSDATWLQADDDLEGLLKSHGWIVADDEVIGVEPAGEGNMNWTLRVKTQRGSLILKQSRPWVEKFPAIAAPVNRALFELRFYETVAPITVVSSRMPKLLGADRQRFLLVLEDLGAARDGSSLYNAAGDCEANNIAHRFGIQIDWLAELHRSTLSAAAPTDFQNIDLRQLNHEHIFQIPFLDPPALDLDAFTPGLSETAAWMRAQPGVCAKAHAMGERYLAPPTGGSSSLLHGDFFPGSWLDADDGVRIIDPEFCYFGEPEFDLGVLAAHLMLIGYDASSVGEISGQYAGTSSEVDERSVCHWAGIEIIRRLLGYAQLPLERSLDQKANLIESAVGLLKQ